jgi:hypothetical protein
MSLLAEQWALRVPLKNVARAGCLRTVRGTEAAVVGDDVWFRGINLDDVLLPTLLAIADGPVFILVDDGRLTPVRHSVPTARLPLVEFASAAILLNPALPPAKLPQKTPQSTQLKLVRCDSERPAELWCGPTAEFRTWAETAPEIRLHACRYAVRSAADAGARKSSAATQRAAILDGWQGGSSAGLALVTDSRSGSDERSHIRKCRTKSGHNRQHHCDLVSGDRTAQRSHRSDRRHQLYSGHTQQRTTHSLPIAPLCCV